MNKRERVILLLASALAITTLICSSSVAAKKASGLHLSVQGKKISAGSSVDLTWEIVEDHISKASIMIGIIRSDGDIYYYLGSRKGFEPFETIDSARPLVKDFPFNTSMSGMLPVLIPSEWPKGTYQFVAAVLDGKEVLEFDYSNSFTVH